MVICDNNGIISTLDEDHFRLEARIDEGLTGASRKSRQIKSSESSQTAKHRASLQSWRGSVVTVVVDNQDREPPIHKPTTTLGKNTSMSLVLPGQLIASSSSENENEGFLRGHGTYVERDEDTNTDRLVASVAGRVERVNKLISVFPFASSVYHGQVGDLVVGRVTSVQATRWKVQLTSVGREAQLPLSGVHLPGGVQRVRTAQDARDMRQFFQEGDLVSAEIHNVQNDGTLVLHTRSLRYGKLENGCLAVVPPALMERRKHHFVSLLGMTVLWGTNGYLWIQRSLPEERDNSTGVALAEIQEKQKLQHADTPVLLEERQTIARIRNSMECLSMVHAMVTPESVERVYQASVDSEIPVRDMLRPEVVLELTVRARKTGRATQHML